MFIARRLGNKLKGVNVAFDLPSELPKDIAELDNLASKARDIIKPIQEAHAAGGKFTADQVAELESAVNGLKAIQAARQEVVTADAQMSERLENLLTDAANATFEPPAPGEAELIQQVIGEAEAATLEEATSSTAVIAAAAATKRPTNTVNFAAANQVNVPDIVDERSDWQISSYAPRRNPNDNVVGLANIAKEIDNINSRTSFRQTGSYPHGGMGMMEWATYNRQGLIQVGNDAKAMVAAIYEAEQRINGEMLTTKSLTAAGGWVAPSVQDYTFCSVPAPVDLISVPSISIDRGGLRWPNDPDVSALLTNNAFMWNFTEPQLEAEDANGNPTAVKQIIEVDKVKDFTEMRLEVVGYAVKCGILQQQGWPELVTWWLETFAAAHLRAISGMTVLRMANGSTPKSAVAADTFGATSGILNAMDLEAVNLRLRRMLSRSFPVEAVVPSHFFSVFRADLALMGAENGAWTMSDDEIRGWFSSRNIVLQVEGTWQVRNPDQPGTTGFLKWPSTMDVLMYPAGTWFRALDPVIRLGTMYPLEQLTVNRFTHFFSEDSFAVGRRLCNPSTKLTLPIKVTGAVGARAVLPVVAP